MTTCTWQLRLHGWCPCTQWCRKNCLCTHASGCITGVEPGWSASRCLQLTGVHCPDQRPRSCGVDGVHHPYSGAGDQGVGDAPVVSRIPSINDVQSAWLLLVHCASAHPCYCLRALRPSMVEEFARAHDAGLWQCLQNILQLDLYQCFVEVMAFQSCRTLGELGRLLPNDPHSPLPNSGVVGTN